MKTTITKLAVCTGFLSVLVTSGGAMATTMCDALEQENQNLAACTNTLDAATRDMNDLQRVLNQNNEQINGRRSEEDRRQRLALCTAESGRLEASIANTADAAQRGQASVDAVRQKVNALSGLVGGNELVVKYECVAIDVKFGNEPDETGRPRVYFGTGPTEQAASTNLQQVILARGNGGWGRISTSSRCFAVLNKDKARALAGDVNRLANEATNITFNGAVNNSPAPGNNNNDRPGPGGGRDDRGGRGGRQTGGSLGG